MTVLRCTVRIDRRSSFWLDYRWRRRCGFSRREALAQCLLNPDYCWNGVGGRLLAANYRDRDKARQF
jgi:hypothetical protein